MLCGQKEAQFKTRLVEIEQAVDQTGVVVLKSRNPGLAVFVGVQQLAISDHILKDKVSCNHRRLQIMHFTANLIGTSHRADHQSIPGQ